MGNLTIKETEFDKLAAVEITTSKARLVALTGMGPRIASFGTRKGRNLLFWDYSRKYIRGQWHLKGGHRVWATRPMGDESEETYADDNEACKVRVLKDGVDIQGASHPLFRIRKSIGIKVLDDETIRIENRITNDSEIYCQTRSVGRCRRCRGGGDHGQPATRDPRRSAGHPRTSLRRYPTLRCLIPRSGV